MTTTTVPDEEIPLLRDQWVLATEMVMDCDLKAVTLASLSNPSSLAPSIKAEGMDDQRQSRKRPSLGSVHFHDPLMCQLQEHKSSSTGSQSHCLPHHHPQGVQPGSTQQAWIGTI